MSKRGSQGAWVGWPPPCFVCGLCRGWVMLKPPPNPAQESPVRYSCTGFQREFSCARHLAERESGQEVLSFSSNPWDGLGLQHLPCLTDSVLKQSKSFLQILGTPFTRQSACLLWGTEHHLPSYYVWKLFVYYRLWYLWYFRVLTLMKLVWSFVWRKGQMQLFLFAPFPDCSLSRERLKKKPSEKN